MRREHAGVARTLHEGAHLAERQRAVLRVGPHQAFRQLDERRLGRGQLGTAYVVRQPPGTLACRRVAQKGDNAGDLRFVQPALVQLPADGQRRGEHGVAERVLHRAGAGFADEAQQGRGVLLRVRCRAVQRPWLRGVR